MAMWLYLVFMLGCCQAIIGSEFRCPIGLNTFSAADNSQYYECNIHGIAVLKTCPDSEFYLPKLERCVAQNGRSLKTHPRSSIPYLSDAPVLGRPVVLGDSYNAREDRILTGESFWSRQTLNTEKQRSVRSGIRVNVYAGRTSIERLRNVGLSKSLSMSYLGGLMEVDGSAQYLKRKNPLEDEQSLTYEYKATTYSHTIKSDIKSDNSHYCSDDSVTHVVSTITYGSSSRLTFTKEVGKNDSKVDISDKLFSLVKKIPSYRIKGYSTVNIPKTDKTFADEMGVDFYGDYIPERNPTTYEESVRIYKRLPEFLGKSPNFDTSTAVKMELTPITRYCLSSKSVYIQIGMSVFRSISNIFEDFEEFETKVLTLLKSKAARKYSEVRNILTWFRISLQDRKSELVSELKQLLPEVRGGKKSEADLIQLIQSSRLFPFTHSKSKEFLANREGEIKIIDTLLDAFDKETTPNVVIKSYKEATDLTRYLRFNKLVILDINILHDASIIEFFLQQKKENRRWYNDDMMVMTVAREVRRFKHFVAANKHNQPAAYLVRLFKYQESPCKIMFVTESENQLQRKEFLLPSKPPTIKLVNVTADSVTFEITTLPADSSVIAYLIRYWKDSEGSESAIPFGPYSFKSNQRTIKNLEPLTSYRFQMIHATGFGQSQPSDESDKIITKPTSPPINVRETGKTNSEISVSWNAPIRVGEQRMVSHYTVSAYKNDKWTAQISVNGLQATFADLEGQTEYLFEVVAVVRINNKEFKSHPSSIKIITCSNPPSDLIVTSIGFTTAVFSWSAPYLYQTSSLKEYSVEYVEIDANGTKIRGSKKVQSAHKNTSIKLADLWQGRSYSVGVRVRINGCVSGFSSNVIIKTSINETVDNEFEKKLKEMQMDLIASSNKVNSALRLIQKNYSSFSFQSVLNQTNTQLRELLINETSRMMKQQKADISNEIDDITQRATGCKWEIGDGTGTSEMILSGTYESKWDCYRACLRKKDRFVAINGATYRGSDSKRCWCEKNMRSVDSNDKIYITCRFAPVARGL